MSFSEIFAANVVIAPTGGWVGFKVGANEAEVLVSSPKATDNPL